MFLPTLSYLGKNIFVSNWWCWIEGFALEYSPFDLISSSPWSLIQKEYNLSHELPKLNNELGFAIDTFAFASPSLSPPMDPFDRNH